MGCIRLGGGFVDFFVNVVGGGGVEKKNFYLYKFCYEFFVIVYKDFFGGYLLLLVKVLLDVMCDCL